MLERRSEILFSRVTPTNKKFVADLAADKGVSESHLVDHILDGFRKKSGDAGDKKKPKVRRRAAS